MYSFSETSRRKLDSCHPILVMIAERALELSQVDFGISEGHRSKETQIKYFREGKSKIDGVNKRSKHQYKPSMAFDVYIYVRGFPKLAYDVDHLCYLAGVITAVGKGMGYKLRWGYNWDCDGVLREDQRFQDLPHFELLL